MCSRRREAADVLKTDQFFLGLNTTRKWSIPDAEKDVGIKNVRNKGFSDAVNNASGDASEKQYFPTHHEGVRKYTSGKGTETERGKERRSRDRRRDFRRPSAAVPPPSVAALSRRCPSSPSVTLVIMSYRRSNFMETDDMFLQFEDDLDNIAGESSSMGENTESFSQQTTPTPRRRVQSRLLELERHIAINGRIPMTIASGAEKLISPHAVRFNQAIGVCVRKTFPVRCLKWATLGENTLRSSRATSRFVEHQMLMTFKEFRADCHRHFKKYSDPEEARANPIIHIIFFMKVATTSSFIKMVVTSSFIKRITTSSFIKVFCCSKAN
ncbi:CACTA en-spm transposon protein [Cucumis melo var. makuwa]|uniref:CACTA en-spm transposon protein n=1 Tax=Cucumis melo var. makuwa TaxID=1194695 RepID=A0A5A7TGC9_CUCMM|nr:CACTA en-spm transposon protein [Cucumis melo var. makuwa]